MTDMKLAPERPLRREDRRAASPRQIDLASPPQRRTASCTDAADLAALQAPALRLKPPACHVTCATIAVIQPVPSDTKVPIECRRQHAMDVEVFPSIGIAHGVSTLTGFGTDIDLVRAALDLSTPEKSGPAADVLAVGWVPLRAGVPRHTHPAGGWLADKLPRVNHPLGTVATITSTEDCT